MPKQIVLGADFRALLPRLSGLSGFALITDPPYSPHVHKRATSCGTGEGSQIRAGNGYVGARHNEFGFDPLTDELRSATAALARRATWSVIFTDIEGGQAWREALPRYIRTIPWIRWSMPQLSGDRPPQGSEYLIVGAPEDEFAAHEILLSRGDLGGRLKYNGPGNLTHYDETCMRGKNKHKTGKPLDLCCRLVEHYSEPNQLVIDPFAGRASIGLACKLLGREYLGIEIDAAEAALATARLAAPLSEDDARRWALFQERRAAELADMNRAAAHTAKIRAKKEAGRAATKEANAPERP